MDKSTLIWAKLMQDDEFLFSALLKLFERQTGDEQSDRITKEHNGVGFNKTDSPVLTAYALRLKQKKSLDIHDVVETRVRMVKYCGQLSRYFTEEEVV